MKCPNHKKNSPDLQTRRTLANGKEVVRDRYCRKCKKYIRTIERFKSDISEQKELNSSHVEGLENENQSLKEKLEDIKGTWKSFNEFLGCKFPVESKKR